MRMSLSLSTLPTTIPVFPLEGALLLPRARLPLNIFEPRYLAMVDDALRSDLRLIGMIQPQAQPQGHGASDAAARDGGHGFHEHNAPLYRIGCAGRITSFSETEDGRYLIALTGLSRFRVVEEVEGFTPFRRMQVDWAPFESDLRRECYDVDEETHRSFVALAGRYFEASQLTADWESLSRADHETLMNAIAMLCPFSPQEKQALLEAPSMVDRERDLRALMEFVVAAPDGGGDLQ
jgi:hypothetical protein